MKFKVPDMSCGHCKASIEKAIGSLDPNAKVAVDLAERTVSVDSPKSLLEISTALENIGFSATLSLD